MIQIIKDWFRPVKHAYQRVVRGYDDRLFWSLRDYVDPMVVAHIKHQQENGFGHPTHTTQAKWNKVLDTMLKGLGDEPELGASKKEWSRYLKTRARALVLLSYYWDDLWD